MPSGDTICLPQQRSAEPSTVRRQVIVIPERK
jgi:hypothetical protein